MLWAAWPRAGMRIGCTGCGSRVPMHQQSLSCPPEAVDEKDGGVRSVAGFDIVRADWAALALPRPVLPPLFSEG